MKQHTFERILKGLFYSSGLYRMGNPFSVFLLTHTSFIVFINLQSIFVNTLFFRVTGNSDIVMKYNSLLFLFTAVFMVMAVTVVRRFSPVVSVRTGILLYAAMYITFLLSLNHLDTMYIVIAVLSAAGGGFYWLAYSILIGEYSTDDNRDTAIGLIGVVSGVVTLVMPLLSGYVISLFDNLTGYVIMLTFSFVVGVLTLFLSRSLTKVENQRGPTHFLLALKRLKTDRLHKLVMAHEFVKCIREGTFIFFLNILLFSVITNEGVVGFNTFLTGLSSIIGCWLYAKVIVPRHRLKSVFYSITILLVLGLMLYIGLSPIVIIGFSVANAFLTPFLLYPSVGLSYRVFADASEPISCSTELFALKEFAVASGRIVGILIVSLSPNSAFGYVTAIIILTLSQYLMLLINRTIVRKLAQKEEEKVSVS